MYNHQKYIFFRDLEIFGNLEIYLRKWISEAFAGILGGPEILYVWDLLFMNKWSKDIFASIALAIIFLIKPWAMKENSNRRMAKVLLEEPGKIYIGMKQIMVFLKQLDKFLPYNFNSIYKINSNLLSLYT